MLYLACENGRFLLVVLIPVFFGGVKKQAEQKPVVFASNGQYGISE